jgi:DNA-binding MarR family transcriptional regulator
VQAIFWCRARREEVYVIRKDRDLADSAGESTRVTAGFQRTPGHLVRRCHQLHNTIFSQETFSYDITAPQFAALRALYEFPNIDQTTLSKIIAFDRATIGGLVDRLETKGLVRRSSDKRDRRIRSLRLTLTGRTLLQKLRPIMERVSERLLTGLSQAESEQFLNLLERVMAVDAEGATQASPVA